MHATHTTEGNRCEHCERYPGAKHHDRCPAGGGRTVLDHERIDAAARMGFEAIRVGHSYDDALDLARMLVPEFERNVVAVAVERMAEIHLQRRPAWGDQTRHPPVAEALTSGDWASAVGPSGHVPKGCTAHRVIDCRDRILYALVRGTEVVELLRDNEEGSLVDVELDDDDEGEAEHQVRIALGLPLAA